MIAKVAAPQIYRMKERRNEQAHRIDSFVLENITGFLNTIRLLICPYICFGNSNFLWLHNTLLYQHCLRLNILLFKKKDSCEQLGFHIQKNEPKLLPHTTIPYVNKAEVDLMWT